MMIPTFLLALAAAAPAAPHRPSQAQLVQVKALTEKLGTCHRSRAAAGAATDAEVDRIVASTLAACQARVTPIRAVLVKVIGADAADATLAAKRVQWEDAIRRIVAAERAKR